MKKILFIEPKPPGEHIFSRFALPRIGVFVLATMMKNRGWHAEIIIEDLHAVDDELFADRDIVGISTITPTAANAYAIADRVRDMGIPVIMGGPHVTFLPDEALEHADFVVRGEGEMPLMKFIDAWETDGDYSTVPNLSYKLNDDTIHNPMQAFEKNLDRFPICDFSLIKDKKELKVIPVQTSRGCPYDCSFCSVTGMFGKKYRYRSNDHILEELRQHKASGKMIFFYDDHFAANRRRAKELLRAMIDQGLTFKFSTQVRADIVNDLELMELMKRAGCHTLFIGFESFNPDSLIEMKKKQTVEDIMKSVSVIHSYGIHIHGMFVHGFDRDTWMSVKHTVKIAKMLELTSAQFLLLTPFPGSEYYEHAEKRIVFKDWGMYDTHHVVYQPINFSIRGLQRAQTYSHENFYSVPQILKKLVKRKWIALGIAIYARFINRKWKKDNRDYLKTIHFMKKNISPVAGEISPYEAQS
ncbi:MAG: B12-binding domain-containing radical SAM protein [Spirochaetes bacterium]|nr:B12-binding domain-containing radical SAM protein [Spirochaetota bacterium]